MKMLPKEKYNLLLSPDVRTRFLKHISEGSQPDNAIGLCWNWNTGLNAKGYGLFHVGGLSVLSHRAAWVMANGLEIEDGKFVLHSCDNRKCVRPSHLFLGTKADNNLDCRSKGRHATKLSPWNFHEAGKKSYANRSQASRDNLRASSIKLTDDQIIIALTDKSKSNSQLGREFGVHNSTISRIRLGRRHMNRKDLVSKLKTIGAI